MALITLSIDHTGKPKGDETGAWGDFDLDGKVDVVEQEAILTRWYGLFCDIRLRTLGHDVVTLSDGRYADRHVRAGKYNADAYIALHLNAGGGDYASAFFDKRSKQGPQLATCIVQSFQKALPVSKAIARETSPTSDFPRPYNCISGIFATRAVACLVEPLFVDCTKHQQFLTSTDGLKKLGTALAEGIDAWLQSRGK